jgi:hypothetical protein
MKLALLLTLAFASLTSFAQTVTNLGNVSLMQVEREINLLNSCKDSLILTESSYEENFTEYDIVRLKDTSEEDFFDEYGYTKEEFKKLMKDLEGKKLVNDAEAGCNIKIKGKVIQGLAGKEYIAQNFEGTKLEYNGNVCKLDSIYMGGKLSAEGDKSYLDSSNDDSTLQVLVSLESKNTSNDRIDYFTQKQMAECTLRMMAHIDSLTNSIIRTVYLDVDKSRNPATNVNEDEIDDIINRSLNQYGGIPRGTGAIQDGAYNPANLGLSLGTPPNGPTW